ncbi:MAG: YoaK family protein [Pseudobdellovibrio sp.]
MLYGNESISTYTRSNISIWMALAFQGGILNVGGFLACHRFVSHLTGFATFFGVEISLHEYKRALGMLLVPVFFLCGAMLSGVLVDIRLKLHKKPKYYLIFGVMFILILVVVSGGINNQFGIFGEPLNNDRDYFLLALLCLICGLQNGTITTVSKSVVRTTHLTGITTDLGIGLVRFLFKNQLPGKIEDEIHANLMRLGIILFFGLGSIAGAIVFMNFGYLGFLVPAIITGSLFSLTYYFQVARSK